MTEFEADVRQKCEIARGACRRKGVRGSRRCTLPSDHLTAAQIEKRNGPVIVVKLNEPMVWEEYCTLPDHLRREYLLCLRNGYGVDPGMLGRMLGIGAQRMHEEMGRLKISIPLPMPHDRDGERDQRQKRWEQFCLGSGEKPGGRYMEEKTDAVQAERFSEEDLRVAAREHGMGKGKNDE